VSAELAVQQAVYARLNSQLSVPVYDHVPQPADSGDDSMFPYVAIGDDTGIEWDTDTSDGWEITLTIHSWSRTRGRLEVKTLQGEIWDALHRHDLAVQGYRTVFCYSEFSETFLEADGLTRHGVQRFRIVIDKGEQPGILVIDGGAALVIDTGAAIAVW